MEVLELTYYVIFRRVAGLYFSYGGDEAWVDDLLYAVRYPTFTAAFDNASEGEAVKKIHLKAEAVERND